MKLINERKTYKSAIFSALLAFSLLAASCGVPNSGELVKANVNKVGSKQKLVSLIQQSQSTNSDAPNASFQDTAPQPTGPEASGDASGRDYVDTNVQVAGVDEGDIVKTDGYQIYYAPRYQNRVHVFEVDDEHEITYQSLIDLDNVYVDGLYLLEEYLVVVGYKFETFPNSCGVSEGDDYACVSWMWYSPTGTVLVIERETLEVVYRLETDSNFLDHRLIENSLFLIGHKYLYDAENELRPSFTLGAETKFVDYDQIYYFSDTPANGMSVLTGIKLDPNPNKITYNASAYLGAGYSYKQIYVSLSDLYISDTNYLYESNKYYQSMTISQFSLDVDKAKMDFVAAGIVEGGMLNQFSMDYYNGYLRVATTNQGATWITNSDNAYSWESYKRFVDNHLYVLKLNAAKDGFTLVSHLSEGLGKPLESIKSVRFLGTSAYIVTFLQQDPLYIIDLSDPTSPVITDEIHLPGFDTYQHPWGENKLLGIGYDADNNGTISGMKLTAYNTTSGGASEIQTRTLNSEEEKEFSWSYSYSEALWNHKALLVSPTNGLFGFPVEAYEYGYTPVPSGDYIDNWYFNYHSYYYLFLIDFSLAAPISAPIIIEHPASDQYYVGVDRAVMIEGYVYTLSDHQVVTYDIAAKTVLEKILVIPQAV